MKIFVTFLCCFLFLIKCGSEHTCELQYILDDMKHESYYIPFSGWSVREKVSFNDSMHYYDLIKDQGDTVYNLRFNLICPDRLDSEGFEYTIALFEKIYFDSIYRYNLIFQDDTAVFYKSPIEQDSDKIFIVGKYYYMLMYSEEFIELGYSTKHLKYIHDNLDSLKHVRGDTLIFPFDTTFIR